jgi:hypothetical protein
MDRALRARVTVDIVENRNKVGGGRGFNPIVVI